jgi:benzoyl-CoA reductase/2-hydroxyglutaryl-CoA dehydratase subunit BcrC/BadD/HgdB
LTDKARKANVEGIILENVRFCEYHGSENSILERSFEEIGVPAMKLEREHGPLTEVGRIKMRIDTFLNRL